MRYIIIATAFLICSCHFNSRRISEDPVARVHDKYLFPSDLAGLQVSGLTDKDSAMIVKNYIDRWIRTQLMVTQAEANLTEKEKDLQKQIENYRSSLLIYKYKQNLLKTKLDTVVTESEIQEYYESNPSNFLLADHIIKGLYLKLPRTAPNLWRVRSWYRSTDEDNIEKLEEYCYEHADVYEWYNEQWVYFEDLIQRIPVKITNRESFLRYNNRVDVRDTTHQYFLSIRDFKLAGTTAPLSMVSNDIKSIILNKRKINFVQGLENEIYRDAQKRNIFEMY